MSTGIVLPQLHSTQSPSAATSTAGWCASASSLNMSDSHSLSHTSHSLLRSPPREEPAVEDASAPMHLPPAVLSAGMTDDSALDDLAPSVADTAAPLVAVDTAPVARRSRHTDSPVAILSDSEDSGHSAQVPIYLSDNDSDISRDSSSSDRRSNSRGDSDSSSVIAGSVNRSPSAAAASAAGVNSSILNNDSDIDPDDDDLVILAVRRALHLPLHPQRPPVRRVHSPVNLVEDDEEEPAAVSDDAAAEEDVCAICLSPPTDACHPICCSHQFCFACLEQWTKIQLASIYQQQEQVLHGFQREGADKKKTLPSCPMCKREYRAMRRTVKDAPAAASNAFAGATADDIGIDQILPPPRKIHQPRLSFANSEYHTQAFERAATAAWHFAVHNAPNLRTTLLVDLLRQHPRVNALLASWPPYRERFRQVQDDLISWVVRERDRHFRSMAVAARADAERQMRRQRQQDQLNDGDRMNIGQVPLPTPMLSDSNAHHYLSRLSPYGTAAAATAAVPAYTNPTLQLYRESRYQGGMTSYLGRMRLWSDMNLRFVPPQPDLVWALRQCGVGQQQREQAHSRDGGAQASEAAASTDHAPATAPNASASQRPSVTQWLNTELNALLSIRVDSSSSPSEHFLVALVSNYLELLLSQLEIDERQRALERRDPSRRRAPKRKRERPETNASPPVNFADASPTAADIRDEAVGSSAAAAASLPSSSSAFPLLSLTFVPSYFATSSTLHTTLAASAPSQLDLSSFTGVSGSTTGTAEESAAATSSATSADPAHGEDDVVLLDERSSETQPASVIVLSDDEAAAPANNNNSGNRDGNRRRRRNGYPDSHLPSGHLHTLFAMSTPLTTAVDYLFSKLEEFLRGFTGVFVHRLLLFILSSAYHSASAGPDLERARELDNTANLLPRQEVQQQQEAGMAQVLEIARQRWRSDREHAISGSGLRYSARSPSPRPTAAEADERHGADGSAADDSQPASGRYRRRTRRTHSRRYDRARANGFSDGTVDSQQPSDAAVALAAFLQPLPPFPADDRSATDTAPVTDRAVTTVQHSSSRSRLRSPPPAASDSPHRTDSAERLAPISPPMISSSPAVPMDMAAELRSGMRSGKRPRRQ